MKSERAKVLHRIGERMILERVIDALGKSGVSKIVTVVGHKAEEVKRLFSGTTGFVRQLQLNGSGDALKHAVRGLKKDSGLVLVTCGDTPLITGSTYRKIIETHLGKKASCTLLTCRMAAPGAYGRIARDGKGNILRIIEAKDASAAEKKISEINVGTYCFNADDLRRFIHRIKVNRKKKEFYLTDIVDIMARNGKKIVSRSCSANEAIGINSRSDLAMANKTINRKKIERLMASGVTVVDPDTTHVAETATVGKDTVVFPHTVIEDDVKIAANCRIGPFARLRPGTRLSRDVEIGNFVEICRTRIGEGTKVKHHTYLGDTTVGRNANIGAGVITANYDGRKKHRTFIGDNASIGVGVSLVAPVRIGKSARVGAGSVVTKNKNVAAGKTVAGVPAKPLRHRGR